MKTSRWAFASWHSMPAVLHVLLCRLDKQAKRTGNSSGGAVNPLAALACDLALTQLRTRGLTTCCGKSHADQQWWWNKCVPVLALCICFSHLGLHQLARKSSHGSICMAHIASAQATCSARPQTTRHSLSPNSCWAMTPFLLVADRLVFKVRYAWQLSSGVFVEWC